MTSLLTRENLARMLVDKHRNYVSNYGRQLADYDRIYILGEKIDQLRHWSEINTIAEADYKRIERESLQELKKLKSEVDSKDVDKRRAYLSEKIKEHEKALGHWSNFKDERGRPKKQA